MRKDWMIKESDIYRAKDDGQITLLKAGLDKSYIVTGCAGSGKSVLALIMAQHIQKERGDDYQIVAYTKSLCGYMESGRKELGLHNDFHYYDEWKYKRVYKTYANGEVYLVCARDQYGRKVPNEPLPTSDYVIVDEIQDFTEEEILEFIHATKKHFLFFGDSAQSIYEKFKPTVQIKNIKLLIGAETKLKEVNLYNNYRLPLPVARLVQYIGVDLPPFDEDIYKSPETSVPYVLQYNDLKAQVSAICRLIKMDLTDVAILLPTSSLVGQITYLLKRCSIFVEEKNAMDFSSTNPKVMTYHSAKGLQFENVFIPALESFYDDGGSSRKALYVAMTRTYKNLYIMYSGSSLPHFWQSLNIPQDLYKTSEFEEIEDI